MLDPRSPIPLNETVSIALNNEPHLLSDYEIAAITSTMVVAYEPREGVYFAYPLNSIHSIVWAE